MQDRASSLALSKPFRDMFVFSGRSRRTEVLAFAILGMLANLVTIQLQDGGPGWAVIRAGWSLLWGFPWIALLVRRLHDQGRSALWAWALIATFAALLASAPLLPQSASGGYRVSLLAWSFHPTGPLAIIHSIVAVAAMVCLFVLCVAPEQPGTNRYGPNPRLDPDNIELATE